MKLASTPSEGIGPTRKLVETLLQSIKHDHKNKKIQFFTIQKINSIQNRKEINHIAKPRRLTNF